MAPGVVPAVRHDGLAALSWNKLPPDMILKKLGVVLVARIWHALGLQQRAEGDPQRFLALSIRETQE